MDLSDDLLCHTFSFLDAAGACACLAVSQRWRRIANADGLWLALVERHPLPVDVKTIKSGVCRFFEEKMEWRATFALIARRSRLGHFFDCISARH